MWDGPDGKETFALGVYVDNLQIVHSAELDEDGNATDENSFYAKFMDTLRRDWDIVDEGPMLDLLGIDCDRSSDGSILLHQSAYIKKLLNRFSPEGPKSTKRALYRTPPILLRPPAARYRGVRGFDCG